MKTEMRTKKRCVLREDEPCVGCMQCMNIFSKKFLSAGKAKAKVLIYYGYGSVAAVAAHVD